MAKGKALVPVPRAIGVGGKSPRRGTRQTAARIVHSMEVMPVLEEVDWRRWERERLVW